jgi:GT2 family glycosyltransferase
MGNRPSFTRWPDRTMTQERLELAPIHSRLQISRSLPTVDVVIPCYNYGHFLPNCVNSVLSQPGVDVRILIIDDSSPDDSATVGHHLAAQYEAVTFRRHDANRGHIATYNEGILDWSSSSYVVLLSADDMLAPGALARAVSVMEEDRSVGMVYGRAFHFHDVAELTTVPAEPSTTRFTRYAGSNWLNKRMQAGNNVITSPEVVVRASVHKAVGGYRNELPHSGDLEMWLRIAAISNIGYLHHVQAYYRVHSSSMQRTQYKTSLLDIVHRKAAFDLFVQHHQHLPGISELQQTVNRTLARESLWDACRAYDHNRLSAANVEELVAFASKTWPDYRQLPEHAALERRKRLGPTICLRTQLFILPACLRWIERKIKRARMLREGI